MSKGTWIACGLLAVAVVAAVALRMKPVPPASTAASPGPPAYTLAGVVRDFRGEHPDFAVAAAPGHVAGNLAASLDAAGRPVYTGDGYRVETQWRNVLGQPIAPAMFGVEDHRALRVLLVVDEAAMDVDDQTRRSRLEGWGFLVTMIDGAAPAADFEATLPQHDVVYVAPQACPGPVPAPLTTAGIGVVVEDARLGHEAFALSGAVAAASGTELVVTGPPHPITEGLAGMTTIATATVPLHRAAGTFAPGAWKLARLVGSSAPAVLAVEAGATLVDGTPAPGRHVRLPWGPTCPAGDGGTGEGLDFEALDGTANLILRRAVTWAAGENDCVVVGDAAGAAGAPDRGAIESSATFNQWFRDVPGVNLSRVHRITLTRGAGGLYGYESEDFHPIDGALLGNEGDARNEHFTYAIDARFTYEECAGQMMAFEGDDDAWLFIDGRLALDLGGVRAGTEQFIELDRLGLTPGATCRLLLLYANRDKDAATFRIKTNLHLTSGGVIPAITAQYD